MILECQACKWWKKDYGMWTFTGWTGMSKDDGHCHLEPKRICKLARDYCQHHAPENGLTEYPAATDGD